MSKGGSVGSVGGVGSVGREVIDRTYAKQGIYIITSDSVCGAFRQDSNLKRRNWVLLRKS
ncbi:MAG: hypothetical protein AB4080_09170 [Trichodesmium sp.]